MSTGADGPVPPEISLVLPAFRAGGFIEANVVRVAESLEAMTPAWEILVVCDGDGDDTAAAARRVADPRVRVLSYPQNEGKGFAICVGVANAGGRYVGWFDADLDIEPSFLGWALARIREGDADAVVGSKRHARSTIDYPPGRRVLSVGFRLLTRLLLRVGVRDTQTGAKLFTREALRTTVPLLLVKRYAFDLEVLSVCAMFGFDRVEEAPIELNYRFSGSGIDAAAVLHMLKDALAIAYRLRIRHWYSTQFAAQQRLRSGDRLDDEPLMAVPLSNLRAYEQAQERAEGAESAGRSRGPALMRRGRSA